MKQKSTPSGGKAVKIAVLFILFLGLLLSLYMTFFYAKTCADRDCFNEALIRCEKASFNNHADDGEWQYIIKGEKGDTCAVYVKNIKILQQQAKKLEGKDMVCSVPKGLPISPENDLDNCHGLLKEAMQDLLIEKLHIYIVQNIGKISQEVANPL